jgi:mannose-1-phosphate guanylyltransferase/mannose-1-phosphate guanylyltransferase/mannose-6-phosphate isomerase
MRLWPLSRLGRPKQFLALDGDRSLLQQTALRIADGELFAPPIVVAAETQAIAVESQLREIAVEPSALILEPVARNTAPAIALAALAADPEELLLVVPSDHIVRDAGSFRSAVAQARPAAEQGWLVTFGMAPDRPETGYGYILRGEELAGGPGAFRAERFVEKPQRPAAEEYLADGRWLWNAGMFLFRAGAFLDALRRHSDYLVEPVEAAMRRASREGSVLRPDARHFARSPAQSADHAVMERHERVAVVPADIGWSDVGSWEALHAALGRDSDDNVLAGDVVAIDSRGSLIRSEGPVVAAIGVTDMIVVATERSVLIVPRAQSQRVQEAVQALIRRGAPPPERLPEDGEDGT